MRIGPYEVLDLLGRGGMGSVHRARGPGGSFVALKVLNARPTATARARFDRERRILAELGEAAGFVPILDAGEADGGSWFTMPLLPGGTLRGRIEAGPLAIPEVIALGTTLAAALGRAHVRSIVHRDLKPENVLFTESGRPLLADLGVAKHFWTGSDEERSVAITRAGSMVGTMAYMPPEQVDDSKSVDPRADVYGLAMILHECLAGETAVHGENALQLAENIFLGRRIPVREARPETPEWLAAVLERALARDRADRFVDGSALHDALVAGAAESDRLERRGGATAGAAGRSLRPGSRTRSLRRVVLALSLTAVSIVGLAAARSVLVRRPSPTVVSPPPPPPSTVVDPLALADAEEQRERALGLEERGQTRGALAEWHRLLDSAPATTAARTEAMLRVRKLADSLPAEPAPLVKWRVKVVIATRTTFSWKEGGRDQVIDATLPDEEHDAILASLAAWRAFVREATRGRVEVETSVETTAEPVKKLQPKDKLACHSQHFPYGGALAGRFDELLAYVYLGDRLDAGHGTFAEPIGDQSVPYGCVPFTRGELGKTSGLREVDLFVSQLRGFLTRMHGWPAHFIPTTTRHRAASGYLCGADPVDLPAHRECLRHILGEHVTDDMWRALGRTKPATNPWSAGDVHAWRVAGPFPCHGDAGAGLDAFEKRDESMTITRDTPRSRLLETLDLALRFDRAFAPDRAVAVARTWVKVPRETSATLLVGSDDGCRIRVAGKIVRVYRGQRAHVFEDDTIPVTLAAGWTPIQATVENLGGPWAISLRVRDASGLPIPGIRLAPDEP